MARLKLALQVPPGGRPIGDAFGIWFDSVEPSVRLVLYKSRAVPNQAKLIKIHSVRHGAARLLKRA